MNDVLKRQHEQRSTMIIYSIIHSVAITNMRKIYQESPMCMDDMEIEGGGTLLYVSRSSGGGT